MKFASLVLAFIILGAMPSKVRAQILPREDQQSDTGFEDLYDQFENQEQKQKAKKEDLDKDHAIHAQKKNDEDLTRLSELSKLAPFEDIAVIQRRFLPKTSRLELSINPTISTNNAFFNSLGMAGKLAYYFRENYGVEGTYLFLTDSNRPITKGLINNQSISTQSLVEPTGYLGAAFKWIPVYGKMAWFQQSIVPFDIYFAPGFGMTTIKGGGSSPTLSLATGQVFALSKSYAVRWDFTWNFYQAQVVTDVASNTKQTKLNNDLFLSIGFSWFFPEATYR